MAAAKKATAKPAKKAKAAKTKKSADRLHADDVRGKTPDELKDLVLSFKKEQFNNRFQRLSGEGAKPSRTRAIRKNIARIKTIMNEQKKAGANA